MFISSRDTSARRRTRVYNHSKTARSSKVSLLSAFTVSTTSSGGSNSTITQESYNRSHKSRRKKSKEHRNQRSHAAHNQSVDVFDFLVDERAKSNDLLSSPINIDDNDDNAVPDTLLGEIEDESGSEEEDEAEHEEERTRGNLDEEDSFESESVENGSTNTPSSREPEPEGYYRSISRSMSDSGISMGSGTSASSGYRIQKSLPIVHEEHHARHFSQAPVGTELAVIDPRWAWPALSPQPHHDGFIPPPCPPAPSAFMYDVPTHTPYHYPYPHPPYTPYGTPPPPNPAEDEMLDSPITIREHKGHSIKPKYFRSFDKVSTRLLLQMQDEIAELEDELAQLDAENDIAVKMSDRCSASSREEKRERRARENDVYQDLHVKLDQYFHALEMAQKVDNMSRPAVQQVERNEHRSWLESRIPDTHRIRHFIGKDLRQFSTPSQEEIRLPQNFQPQYLAYSAFINSVVPLMMFKMVAGVLNRLILLSFVVIIGAVVQDRMRTRVGKDELTCTLVCICISAFAAIFY